MAPVPIATLPLAGWFGDGHRRVQARFGVVRRTEPIDREMTEERTTLWTWSGGVDAVGLLEILCEAVEPNRVLR